MKFDYNKAIRQAEAIENVANEMMRTANSGLQTTIDSIDASWKGASSRQFIRHSANIQSDIKTESRNLTELAGRIREVARLIKEAEERAAALKAKKTTTPSKSNIIQPIIKK